MQPIHPPTRLSYAQSRITKRKFINRMKKAGLNYLLIYHSGNWWSRANNYDLYLASNDCEYLDNIAKECFGTIIHDCNLSYVEKIY
jgi:hypothetical protein